MIEDQVLATVNIVDVAQEARRIFGEEKAQALFETTLPQHDYRFAIVFPDGGNITFSRSTTAAMVMDYLRDRQGRP